MEFVVRRSQWARGYSSRLFSGQSGLMCCLGFCAMQLGVSEGDIYNVGIPQEIETADPNSLAPLVELHPTGGWVQDTDLSNDAVEINDEPNLEDADREMQLSALFKKHGHSMRFED